MNDLLERLQGALGDAYRIERELGGGGMLHAYMQSLRNDASGQAARIRFR